MLLLVLLFAHISNLPCNSGTEDLSAEESTLGSLNDLLVH